MQRAPSVSYSAGRSRRVAWLLGSIWASGALCAAAAIVQADKVDARTAVFVLATLAAGAVAWHGVRHNSTGHELRFDGQQWSLAGPDPFLATQARVVLDLQGLVLICLTSFRRRRRWVWIDRSVSPERWLDLRRAVYSRAPRAGSAVDLRRTASSAAQHPIQ